MMLKWLERREYLFSLSIAFFIAFRPSHAFVIASAGILDFRLISPIIYNTWNMTASLLLYAYWCLGCPGLVQEAAIWCVACSAPSIISSAEPQSSL